MLNGINVDKNLNGVETVLQPDNAGTANVNLNNKLSVTGKKQLELNKTKTDAVLHNLVQTIPARKTLANDRPTFKRFGMNMDQALDTLLLLKERLNGTGKNFGTLEIGSFALEKVKNAFWKFVGFFNKSSAEKRTQQLHAKIDDFLQNLDAKNETNNFVSEVIVPVLNDKDVYTEDKIACFDMFDRHPELQGKMLKQCAIRDKSILRASLKTCFSITGDRASEIFKDNLPLQPLEMNDRHREISKNIHNFLSGKTELNDLKTQVTIPVFNEVFRNGNGRFTFNFDDKTVCDINKNDLQKEVRQERIKNAKGQLQEAQQTKDETKIEQAKKHLDEVQCRAPRLNENDFLNAIRKQIGNNRAKDDAINQLALFLASDTPATAPVDSRGRRLCGTTDSHFTCNVSKDGTCTVNQTFEKVRDFGCSSQLGADPDKPQENVALKEVLSETYTETTLEVEYKFETIGYGRPTSKVKKFQQEVKFFSELNTDEKLSLLHDDYARIMRESEQGTSSLDKKLFTDKEFLSEVLKDKDKAKEFMKDFCCLNRAEAEKQLKDYVMNGYVVSNRGLEDLTPERYSEIEKQQAETRKQAHGAKIAQTASLGNYFLDKGADIPQTEIQLFKDFNRGWGFDITIDGTKIFTGRNAVSDGTTGQEKVTREAFFARIKEAIQKQSEETKEKIADFIVNASVQGYIAVPLYKNAPVLAIGDCKPTIELNIDTKSDETNFTVGGTYEEDMCRQGMQIFSQTDPEEGIKIGASLNQKVDFKFRYDYDGLLMRNEGKISNVEVEQFDQMVTDNVPNKAT